MPPRKRSLTLSTAGATASDQEDVGTPPQKRKRAADSAEGRQTSSVKPGQAAPSQRRLERARPQDSDDNASDRETDSDDDQVEHGNLHQLVNRITSKIMAKMLAKMAERWLSPAELAAFGILSDTPEVSPEMQGATQQLLAELDVDGIANNARRHEFAMLVVEKALDGIKTLAAEPTPSQHRAQDLLETIYTMADATQAVLNGDEARAEAGRRELARKVGMDLEDADEE